MGTGVKYVQVKWRNSQSKSCIFQEKPFKFLNFSARFKFPSFSVFELYSSQCPIVLDVSSKMVSGKWTLFLTMQFLSFFWPPWDFFDYEHRIWPPWVY